MYCIGTELNRLWLNLNLIVERFLPVMWCMGCHVTNITSSKFSPFVDAMLYKTSHRIALSVKHLTALTVSYMFTWVHPHPVAEKLCQKWGENGCISALYCRRQGGILCFGNISWISVHTPTCHHWKRLFHS